MARLVRTRRRRAAAVIEAALIMPMLMILTVGLLEYGWMYLKAEQITNAARNGCRAGCRTGASYNTTVKPAVDKVMQDSGMAGSGYTVSYTDATAGNMVNVTVRVNYANIHLIATTLLPLPVQLQGRVNMVKEG